MPLQGERDLLKKEVNECKGLKHLQTFVIEYIEGIKHPKDETSYGYPLTKNITYHEKSSKAVHRQDSTTHKNCNVFTKNIIL